MHWYNVSWNVAVRDRNCRDKRFHVLKNPKWGWCADPFVIERNGKTYLFAEIWVYKDNKGAIGYTEISKTGESSGWKIVIREEYHLSYPHFVTINDKLFICPEANKTNTVYLYQSVRFPDQWEKQAPFIQGVNLSDTTLVNMGREFIGVGCKFYEKPMQLVLFKASGDFRQIEYADNMDACLGSALSRPGGSFFVKGENYIG